MGSALRLPCAPGQELYRGKVPWVVLHLPPFLIQPGVPTTAAPGPGSVSVMRREDTEISGSEGGNTKEEDLENTVN